MRRRPRLWLVVLWVAGGLALLAIATAVILPPLVSTDYHRAAIEALASRLTGREVVIKGRISLSMVPVPQLSAAGIHIDVSRGEHISASSLRIDLAPRALLFGRLRATRLSLQSPRIVIPWPLPGGAASILPPPWLSSLHARIEDGTIILGRLPFTHANLSIFTGGGNAVLAASGTGTIFGLPVSASLHLAGANLDGASPVAASISTPIATLAPQKAGISFRGTVNAKSQLTGTLAGSALPVLIRSFPLGHIFPLAPLGFTAHAMANRKLAALTHIKLAAGKAALEGSARIDLLTGVPTLSLTGHGIDATPVLRLLGRDGQGGPGALRAMLTDATLCGFKLASLSTEIQTSAGRATIRSFDAKLPGNGRLGFTGTLDRDGLHGRFTLADQTPATLADAAASIVPDLAALPRLAAPLRLAGSLDAPRGAGTPAITIRLGALQGMIGTGATLASGAVVAQLGPLESAAHGAPTRRLDAHASLAFTRLNATPLLKFVAAPTQARSKLMLDVSITADQAKLGAIEADRFLLDARLANDLTLRAFEFFAMTPQHRPAAFVVLRGERGAGRISHATLLVNGPNAAQAMPLLPPMSGLDATALPEPLFKAPFAVSLSVSGPLRALALDAAIDLGPMRLRAQPEVNLLNDTAKGPLSFRMPDAIALTKPWDKRAGLDWPGAGSVGLRADFLAAPQHFALPNFVLSFGALTASGHLALDYGTSPARLDGVLNAETLILPPNLLQLATAPHRIAIQIPDLTAAHIRLGQTEVARNAALNLAVMPQSITLGVTHATLAGGTLTGQAAMDAAEGASPPALKADLKLAGADAAVLASDMATAGFPLPVAAGRLDLALAAQATGYTAKTWEATLAGSLTGSGTKLTVSGIDLAKAAQANPAAIKLALLSGSTSFGTMALSGSFGAGAFTIGKAELDGSTGSATLSGSIDLPDRSFAVTTVLHPKPVQGPAPDVTMTLSGPWEKPKRNIDVAPGSAPGGS